MAASTGIVGSRVSVLSASAVPLNSILGFRQQLVITNLDATNAIDLGAAGVTAGNGFQVKPGVTITLVVPANEQLFAIATAAPVSVSLLTTKNTAR